MTIEADGDIITKRIYPVADGTHDLGDNTKSWRKLYVDKIFFNGDTADANGLDDYEEGTWTVTANNSVTLHAGTDLGAYTRIGRVVHCQSQFQVNSDNSTSALSINLPFTTAASFGEGANYGAGAVRMYDGTVPSGVLWAIVYPETGNTVLNFSGTRAGASSTPILAAADAYYMFSITYMVAT